MVKPQQVVREILDHIGKKGIVAGGAVRDIILERTPKDYDVFIFEEEHMKELVAERGIFDKVPERVPSPNMYGGGFSFQVYNATLHGKDVQIIWSPDFTEYDDCDWTKPRTRIITADELVRRFPFTINMVYIDSSLKIVVLPEAKRALKRKQMIFNHKHEGGPPPSDFISIHLHKRVFYLADKLGFTIPMATLIDIARKYDYTDELSLRDWSMKGEEASVPY